MKTRQMLMKRQCGEYLSASQAKSQGQTCHPTNSRNRSYQQVLQDCFQYSVPLGQDEADLAISLTRAKHANAVESCYRSPNYRDTPRSSLTKTDKPQQSQH